MHAFTFSATDPALYMVLVLGGLNLRCLANFKSGSRLGCGNAEMKRAAVVTRPRGVIVTTICVVSYLGV